MGSVVVGLSIARPVSCDGVFVLQSWKQMVCVLFTETFDAEKSTKLNVMGKVVWYHIHVCVRGHKLYFAKCSRSCS